MLVQRLGQSKQYELAHLSHLVSLEDWEKTRLAVDRILNMSSNRNRSVIR